LVIPSSDRRVPRFHLDIFQIPDVAVCWEYREKNRVWFYSISTITIYHHLYRIIPSILNLEVSLDGTLSSKNLALKNILNTGPTPIQRDPPIWRPEPSFDPFGQ